MIESEQSVVVAAPIAGARVYARRSKVSEVKT